MRSRVTIVHTCVNLCVLMTSPCCPDAVFPSSCDRLPSFPSSSARFLHLLSICDGVDIGLHGLNLNALCSLRGMCVAAHATVDRLPVQVDERIWRAQLPRHRACFPAAATWNLVYAGFTDTDLAKQQPHLHCRVLAISHNPQLSGAVLSFFPNLHTLRMAQCAHIPEDAVSRLSDLQALDVSLCPQISGAVLARWPLLRELAVRGCGQMTDTALSRLHNLHTLDISYCRQLTDAALSAVPLLEDLNATKCSGITDDGLTQLPNLRALDISRCNHLTGRTLPQLLLLQELIMQGCSQVDGSVLLSLPILIRLRIDYCHQITDAHLTNLPRLQELHMSRCHGIRDAAFAYLPDLQMLGIHECLQVSQWDESMWARLPRLHKVIMHVEDPHLERIQQLLHPRGVRVHVHAIVDI
jgi:hypothetical protein